MTSRSCAWSNLPHLRGPGRFLLLAVLVAAGASAGEAAWRFTDVTAESGLVYQQGFIPPVNFAALSGGVAAGDYDGDGHVDLYVTRGDIGPNLLFRNRGDGTFEEVGAAAGVALDGVRSAAPLFADLDGDGRLDLVVGGVGDTAPSVFRNAGGGHFTDVIAASGLTLPADRETYSISAADYDRDGDLDLYIGSRSIPGEFPNTPESRLLKNDKGKFTEVTASDGPELLHSGMVTGALLVRRQRRRLDRSLGHP